MTFFAPGSSIQISYGWRNKLSYTLQFSPGGLPPPRTPRKKAFGPAKKHQNIKKS